MNFVYTANPPAKDAEPLVANDPWFPAVTPTDVRDAANLDGTATEARLRNALRDAFDTVNRELSDYRERMELAGHATLAEVPARQLDGQSLQVLRYRRAVVASVQAQLVDVHREIDTTPHSDGKEGRIRERLDVKRNAHLRALRLAISDLLGIARTTVELI